MAAATLLACSKPTPADAGADASVATCDPEGCSNGIFCDGVEVCVDGECQPDPDALCVVSGCRIVCDDGVVCTEDDCDEQRRRCVHRPIHDRCDDGAVCNGEERCEPGSPTADARGCVAGIPLRCDDEDPCTDDICVEGACQVEIRDADRDGYGDINCQLCPDDDPLSCRWGTDCDDGNPRIFPGSREICDDGLDNDCDRRRDYDDPACSIPNDDCGSPLELRPGEPVRSSTRGATSDLSTSCGGDEDRDVVFSFALVAPRDVAVSVSSVRGGPLSLSLTDSCDAPEGELQCLEGREFGLRLRALPPGTYFVIARSPFEVDFEIRLDVIEPSPPAEGDGCENPWTIDAEGGRFSGSTEGAWADQLLSCGSPSEIDVVYRFELDEPRSLELTLEPGEQPLTAALQRDCGGSMARSCMVSTEALSRRFIELEPGPWHLVFSTPFEDAFSFEARFAPPLEVPFAPAISTEGHVAAARRGSADDGQYDLDISPASFPFDGQLFDCVAVSTNGYIRFGRGSCPRASGYADRETDIDLAFAGGIAQISWLGDDAVDDGAGLVWSNDRESGRVVLTFRGHREVDSEGTNDVQIVLFTDTGDIQISYLECTFDNTVGGHWSIGLSEPSVEGAALASHDFVNHESGTAVSFGPGAISQSPSFEGPAAYAPLGGRAIFFQRQGDDWQVVVNDITSPDPSRAPRF